MDGLDAKRVRGPERGGDVAEVAEPFHDERLVREKRLAVHLHQRGDAVGTREEVLNARRLGFRFFE